MAKKQTPPDAEAPDANQPPLLRRECGAMAAHFRLLETDVNFRSIQAQLETATTRRMARGLAAFEFTGGPMIIKVVVHVVYNTTVQNISTAQIKSQINVLNRDFGAKNPDRSKVPVVWKGLVGNPNIQFQLATVGPDGKKTTGITRTKTQRTSFGTNDTVKTSAVGKAPWPTDRYLNIWVCNLGGGLLGYAQFPGGPAETDGVVITYRAFGTSGTAVAPFNLGRTTTHEIGHYLNLRHIWGDTEDCSGTDFVKDTPNAVGPNYGKPTFPHISCTNGPNGDMFMNYMDYVDDDSMYMFTIEQIARMHATLEDVRNSLIS
ncbi:zinc metalloprotease [Spirosoma sp.]|uniref:zinc metalloprotease n=1 Tax=Spirosoma sp. TaxID=1899569 RepID=UPI003B3B8194